MASDHVTPTGQTDGRRCLVAAKHQCYSNMCDELFQKYMSIKARSVEGKRSLVWKCFVPGNTASMCRLCRAQVKHGMKGSTSNLRAHWQRHHFQEWNELVETDAFKRVTNVYASATMNANYITLLTLRVI